MRRLASVLAALLFLAAAPAYADDTFGESLDWLITSRPSIAVETVTSTAPVPAKPGVTPQLTIQTTLKTSVKGQPPQQASFVRRWQAKAVPGQDDTARPENGTEYLLFFDQHGSVTNAINLKFPSRRVGFGADPNDVALGDDFSIFKSGDLIMEAVNARVAWLKDHPPLSGSAAGGDAFPAVPEGAAQLAVPMTSPAWDVLYAGGAGQCLLRIPADMQERNVAGSSATQHKIEFAAPVTQDDCGFLPSTAFRIKSATDGAAHTLEIRCGANKNTAYDVPLAMTMSYVLSGDLHDGDYGFEWGSNPDTPGDPRGYFADREHECEEFARAVKFRLPRQAQIPPATPDAKPLYASWTADCIASDVWQFVMEFQLSIRSTPEEAAAAAATPLASVSSAVASQAGASDIIILAKPAKNSPAPPPVR